MHIDAAAAPPPAAVVVDPPSKRPKRYTTTTDAERDTIIRLRINTRMTCKEMQAQFKRHIPLSTIHTVIRQYKKRDMIEKLRKGGSRPKYTQHHKDLLVEYQVREEGKEEGKKLACTQ